MGRHRSYGLGGGVRLNVNKRSVSVSAGTKGLRYTVNSSGRRTTTVSVPGLSATSTRGGGHRSRTPSAARRGTPPTAVVRPARPGLFAPAGSRRLYRLLDVTPTPSWVADVEGVAARYPGLRVPALMLLGVRAQAVSPTAAEAALRELVYGPSDPAADQFLARYVATSFEVTVVSGVSAKVPVDRDLARLLLIDLYQGREDHQAAATVAEQLGDTVVGRLERAQYAVHTGNAGLAVSLTEGVSNVDDLSVLLLAFRGSAFRDLERFSAAMEVFKEGLRYPSRAPAARHFVRYERARTALAQGRKAAARQDLERILAEDSQFPGVREALRDL